MAEDQDPPDNAGSGRTEQVPEDPTAAGRPDEPDPAVPEDASSIPGKAAEELPERTVSKPFRERIVDDEQEWRERQENLRDLHSVARIVHAGRDWIGALTNQVSDSGMLNHIGGDLHIHRSTGADPPIEIRHMPSAEARWLDDPFLATPPSLGELTAFLKGEPLVFLRGPEGTGRWTTALAALLRWTREAAPPADPANEAAEARIGLLRLMKAEWGLGAVGLRPGHGYVLDATAPEVASRLGARTRDLWDLARTSESRLVVLVATGQLRPAGLVVEHRPPPAIEVFSRWLERTGGTHGIRPSLPPEVSTQIAEHLKEEISPAKAVENAYEVIGHLATGRPYDAILSGLPGQTRAAICERLAEHRPVLGRCFMVSVAVLHELPETTVSQAALDLADRVDRAAHPEGKRRHRPSWEQLRTWLDYAGAETLQAQTAGRGRAVRLKRRTTAAITLRTLWEEQPTVRKPLMDWLRSLCENSRPPVRIKAAHAIGLLATFDFDLIESAFLDPWSRSRRPQEHRLAALVLESMAQDPAFKQHVHEHLRRLTRGTHGQRSVVVRAYGSSIGLEEPAAAFRAFGAIAHTFNRELNAAIARSVACLYSEKTAKVIMRELTSWEADRSPGGRHTAALAFVRLAALPAGDPARPALTELTLEDEELRARLVALWRNALEFQVIDHSSRRTLLATPQSWELLAEWVSRYEDSPAIRPIIDTVIGGSGSETSQLRKTARLYLRLWWHRKRISTPLYVHLSCRTEGG